MSIKALRKALAAKHVDEFRTGDVIRWQFSSDRYKGTDSLTYAALKTPKGWYTTATGANWYVEQKIDLDGLVEALTEKGVSDIQVAVAWEDV